MGKGVPETERKRLYILLIAADRERLHDISSALRASNTRCQLMMIPTGPQTLPYLRREGRYVEAPAPDLILFDAVDVDDAAICMIRKIKGEAAVKDIPVVLLARDESMHKLEGICLGETCYTAFSPVDLASFFQAMNAISPGRFMQAISHLENFGFVLVRMPERAGRGDAVEPAPAPERPARRAQPLIRSV